MWITEQYEFFINSGYFTDDYRCTETDFFCTSSLTGQEFRIQPLLFVGYRVYLKKQEESGEQWELQLEVADKESALGVITKCEDDWMKQAAKEEKKKDQPL